MAEGMVEDMAEDMVEDMAEGKVENMAGDMVEVLAVVSSIEFANYNQPVADNMVAVSKFGLANCSQTEAEDKLE